MPSGKVGIVFGKEKSKDKSDEQAHEVVGKGRPTRTRKEAEAANRRPMIPKDRREAKRRRRERENAIWERQQRAMETGDERYMPARDKGKIRRFTRDYVDARWTLAEFVLPSMLVLIIAMFSMIFLARLTTPETAALVVQVVTYVTYGLLIFSVFESILINLQIKKIVTQKWPNEPWIRNWFYTFSRMIMLRRWRQPRPQVKRGEHPEK
ncbi:DUF3043 domain-containing protein [uncultured Actinomyces sp.]|uniref:DUF3043 domain-containing protein n=1 Tax=Gleimia europaea ACS-120-V-Col10b TaxID=883069 RepID=A0A9W5RDG5_9ACTO|nr:DUF3043 domain-containing protein [uncultured Actinomyces sp.]EPD30370.1 hypothetical protein HMPREF9238_00108 [Gleimia europaea ACS-120-V-Col10b]